MLIFKIIIENSSLIFVILVLGSLSGLISEKSGIINIHIEGMMTIGALIFVLFGKNIGINLGNLSQIIALILAGLGSMIFSIIYAFASINLKSNQIILGIAINMLAAAISNFIIQLPNNNGFISLLNIYELPKINNNIFFNLYLFLTIIILVIFTIFLKYTQWGLRHIATGENPDTVKSVGINIIKQKYIAVLLSGFLAGIAGGIFPMYNSQTFRGTVNGNGFIALAILIFGQWKISLITIGAILFSIIETIGARITFLPNINEWILNNSDIWNILPFIISLLILIFTSKWSKMPQALGKNF